MGMSSCLRVLFLADTHLGFDFTFRPRIERRRRGDDFFANYERALAPALAGEVDLVVHGGDLFHRSRVPAALVQMAFAPLKRVADSGVDVVVVPGNHERSVIPFPLLSLHPRIHIFRNPQTFELRCGGMRVAIAGFPYARRNVRSELGELLGRSGIQPVAADIKLLAMHHCVQGATVGPSNYTFVHGHDVIVPTDLPAGLAAVLSGHIHRHQVLTRDRAGRPLPASVLYSGSIERTSTAEKDERKGYMLLSLAPGPNGGALRSWRFVQLPARPMVGLRLSLEQMGRQALQVAIEEAIGSAPADAVMQLRVTGEPDDAQAQALQAARLRAIAPASMNIRVTFPTLRRLGRSERSRTPWRWPGGRLV